MFYPELRSVNRDKKVEISALLTDITNIVMKVDPDKRVSDIEKALTRYLKNAWNDRSTKGIEKSINGIKGKGESKFTKTDKNKILKTLDGAYAGIQKEITSKVKDETKRSYNIYKRYSKSQLREKSFTKQDEEEEEIPFKDPFVIANLARIRNVSIGTHFERSLRPQISKIIETAVLDKGLNKKQAGEFLKSELTRKLGGEAFKDSIPVSVYRQGQKSVDNYFEGLSVTHMTMTKSFAQVTALNEAQVAQVVFVAVIDNRTSQICLEMDGRIWDIEIVNDLASKMLEVEDVDELKKVAPWKKDLSEFNVGRGEKVNDPVLAGNLAKAGVLIPPLHFRCRSELQPV